VDFLKHRIQVKKTTKHSPLDFPVISIGQRVVGFDNERGKGDHCHLDGKEIPYKFLGTDKLIEDFIAEIEKRRQT